MKVVILKDAAAVAKYGADLFIKQVKSKPDSILGLATGSTPVALYKELISAYKEGRVSFRQVCTFNLDEYAGLPGRDRNSYRHYMNEHLFAQVNIEGRNTHLPDGMAADHLVSFTTLGVSARIYQIQGARHVSPLVNQVVSGVPGIVTAVRPNIPR